MTTVETSRPLPPASGNPKHEPASTGSPFWEEDDQPEQVRWDLTDGAFLCFAKADEGDGLIALLYAFETEDGEQAHETAIERAVTRDQVIGFARHLLALVKGDDDIETIAAQLSQTAAMFNKRVEERAEQIAAPRVAEAREQVAEVMAELERVGEFHQQRLDDLRGEFQRQIRVRDQQIERLIAAANKETR